MGKEIEILEFPERGYRPIADYQDWRVAGLKFCEDLKLENIRTMQKHSETDEVFVLLRGSCTLFLGGAGACVGMISKVELKPHKVYVVKKNVWHNHIMTEDGEVLIVENRNTTDENSPVLALSEPQIEYLRNLQDR